jgi:hypothetical protein
VARPGARRATLLRHADQSSSHDRELGAAAAGCSALRRPAPRIASRPPAGWSRDRLRRGATPGARSAGSRVWVPPAAATRHGGRVTPRISRISGPGQTGSTGRQLIKGRVRRLRDRRRAS